MLKEPTVPTNDFHDVLFQLQMAGLHPANEDLDLFMNDLLHPPKLPEEWGARAKELSLNGLIATVTENEAFGLIQDDEETPAWDELANRVVKSRISKSKSRIVLDISYGDFALAIEPE